MEEMDLRLLAIALIIVALFVMLHFMRVGLCLCK